MPRAPSMKQIEDSFATTSCRPLVAVVDISEVLQARISNSVTDYRRARKRLSRRVGRISAERGEILTRTGRDQRGTGRPRATCLRAGQRVRRQYPARAGCRYDSARRPSIDGGSLAV